MAAAARRGNELAPIGVSLLETGSPETARAPAIVPAGRNRPAPTHELRHWCLTPLAVPHYTVASDVLQPWVISFLYKSIDPVETRTVTRPAPERAVAADALLVLHTELVERSVPNQFLCSNSNAVTRWACHKSGSGSPPAAAARYGCTGWLHAAGGRPLRVPAVRVTRCRD